MRVTTSILICVIFLTASCSSTKRIKTGAADIHNGHQGEAGESLRKEGMMALKRANDLPFQTLSARVKVEYEDANGKQPETNSLIRMQKDEFIWVSVTATFLNIEAARVLITPDSIIVVNKLEKTIEAHPVSFIQEKISLPLTFKDIQNLIAGNIILAGDSAPSFSASDKFLKIITFSPQIENQIYLTLPELLLARQSIDVSSLHDSFQAEVLYEDYEKTGDGYFSTNRSIAVPAHQQQIKLSFKQYEFNKELSVPFSRPDGYTIK